MYKRQDWLISRQRYWGTPIPIIYCDLCGTVPVPAEELPVILPEDAEFLPTGESPLALHEDFVNTECPNCKGSATRETDTMDTFVDSSWYFLRYTSPNFKDAAFDPETVNNWNPVDQYTGGVEHAVMHLLYARFFVKAIRDLGLINFHEPFQRLFNQGTIIYKGAKMSKSRGNVIAPDEYVKGVGADVVRTYLMFIGPWDQGGEWNDSGINGAARWLNRVWELASQDKDGLPQKGSPISDKNLERDMHLAIKKVTGDLDRFKYNTAISSLMEYTTQISEQHRQGQVSVNVWTTALDNLLIMMSPIVPHLTEELWESIGNSFSIHKQEWPKYDSDLATHEEITLVVQVNGKLRDRIQAPAELEEEGAKQMAFSSEKVEGYLQGKEIKKIIYIKGRLINIVVS